MSPNRVVHHVQWWKRNRKTAVLAVLGAVTALFLVFGGVAFAVHDLGLFQLDYVLSPTPEGAANVSHTNITPPGNTGDDWDQIYAGTSSAAASVFVPDPVQAADHSYFTGGGSKDTNDINQWQYGVGNNTTPPKDDLNDIFAAAYKPTSGTHVGHTLLYFGADRFDTNGDSDIGFWFFRSQVTLGANGSFTGVHQNGDILVVANFVTGGSVGDIAIYQWLNGALQPFTFPPGQTHGDCSTAGSNDIVCAVINNIAGEQPPWPYTNSSAGNTYAAGALFEGGLDLNEVLNVTDVGCFSSFLGETRSAQAVNASLKDFALGQLNTCQPLSVSKTAQTTFTRTYNWTINKSVTPNTWDMFQGDTGTSQYTVSVNKTGFTDSAWHVSGQITIQNPNATDAATITGVTDDVGGTPATVNCGVSFPYTLAGGGTLTCSYSANLPDGTNRTNTATVTTSGPIGGGQGTASVTFGAPATEVNATVHVTDTNGGSWTFSASGSQTYSKTFACNTDQGAHNNTATITETGQSSSASVTVNCYAPTVTKTANTSLTRTFAWTINKSVTPDTWNLFQGDSGTSQYTVAVTKDAGTASGFAATGSITVHNPAPIAATINSVTDVTTAGNIVGAVNCGNVVFPYSLAGGGDLTCSYTASLPDATDRTNTATATLQNYSYDSAKVATLSGTTDFSGTAAVSFANATITLVNDTIHVTDTNGGSWTFSASGSQTYSKTFACNTDQGAHNNTATITETGQSSSASVTVNCYAPTVTKTANTSLTRAWSWTIQKSGDQSSLTLSIGQVFTVNYTIVVNATSTDSAWGASGSITVHNPAPMAATINSVADVISGGINGTVSCPGGNGPYTIAAGGNLICSYTASLPDATSRTNTATATLQNYNYDSQLNATPAGVTPFSGTAPVSFATATINSVDECINVTDTFAGNLGTVCAGVDTLPKTFTYSRTIGPYGVCGNYTVDNTAAFVTNDTGTTGSSSWTVNVNVPCVGCTLTFGYWKTHSNHGPAPFDDTWNLILPSGADSPFFLSGQTYYQVLWTPPKGNAYYILADQYIAAVLNKLNGASSTPEVDAAITWAQTFFSTYTPSSSLTKAQRAQVIYYAGILGSYNEGLIGPGHCSEQSS